MKIMVLGAGRVGGVMAADLAVDARFEVTVADLDTEKLSALQKKSGVKTVSADLSDTGQVKKLVADQDLVVDAVPGFMGFRTFQAVIEAGKNVVDIAFFPEDPFPLDELARKNGVIAVMDCGVAPGMSNLLIGHVDSLLDETENAVIYVGGLPRVRQWPYEYKAVFSPIDVIEEYTRPARYVENGRPVVREALSDLELIDFPEIGTLEVFNTDGLRTLMETISAPNMKEKTMRYPGHVEKMMLLRETGFFRQDPIEINGTRIRPLDFTAGLLFPKWELKEGEADLTVMQVMVEGRKDGRRLRYTYDLLDRYDEKTGTTSMARTTGYTATAAARMIADGVYDRKGVSPPEYIGQKQACVEYMLAGLKERNIIYRETVSRPQE